MWPEARATYSLLLGELVLQQWSTVRVFADITLGELLPLPENEEFLVEQLRPGRVAEYLAMAAADLTLLGDWERQRVELAFDWMAAVAG